MEGQSTRDRASRGGWRRGLTWLLLAVGIWFVWSAFRGSVTVVPAEDAPAAGPLALRQLDGAELRLDDLRGKVVLVNVWASWCGPCRSEIPMLSELSARYRDRGLEVLGVSVDDLSMEQIGAAAERMGMQYPVLVPTAPFEGAFRTEGIIPHSWIVDRAGRIRVSHAGVPGRRSLFRACESLLAEDAG